MSDKRVCGECIKFSFVCHPKMGRMGCDPACDEFRSDGISEFREANKQTQCADCAALTTAQTELREAREQHRQDTERLLEAGRDYKDVCKQLGDTIKQRDDAIHARDINYERWLRGTEEIANLKQDRDAAIRERDKVKRDNDVLRQIVSFDPEMCECELDAPCKIGCINKAEAERTAMAAQVEEMRHWLSIAVERMKELPNRNLGQEIWLEKARQALSTPTTQVEQTWQAMEDALKFYADKGNYTEDWTDSNPLAGIGPDSKIRDDRGERARQALGDAPC
jgi:hypothetical protein